MLFGGWMDMFPDADQLGVKEEILESGNFSSGRQWRIYPLAKSAMAPLWPKKFFLHSTKKFGKLGLAPPLFV